MRIRWVYRRAVAEDAKKGWIPVIEGLYQVLQSRDLITVTDENGYAHQEWSEWKDVELEEE